MMEMLIGVLRFNDKDKAGRGFLTFCIEHFGSCSDFSPIIFGINLFNYVLEDFVRCIVGEMVYQILLRGYMLLHCGEFASKNSGELKLNSTG
nr:uncharacterized protein LOC113714395 isoform X2 [Coffea arabica]